MRRTGLQAAAATVAALALSACGGTVSCGGCPSPLYVNLLMPSGSPTAVAEPTAAPSMVQVCVTGLPCQQREWHGGGSTFLELPSGVRAADLDGRDVTARVVPTPGDADLGGRSTLTYHDGGGGECSCSYATSTIQLSG